MKSDLTKSLETVIGDFKSSLEQLKIEPGTRFNRAVLSTILKELVASRQLLMELYSEKRP